MKKILIALLTLGSISSFAGIIVNEKNQSEIHFDVQGKSGEQIVVVKSSGYNDLVLKNANKDVYELKRIDDDRFEPIYYTTKECADTDDCALTVIPLLATAVGETLLLPVTGVAELISDISKKKTFTIMQDAIIYKNSETFVSDRRFGKIIKLLRLTKK